MFEAWSTFQEMSPRGLCCKVRKKRRRKEKSFLFNSVTCILGFLQPFDPNKRKSHLKKELKRNFPFARVNPET